jgi:hypothetical protein
MDEPTLNERFYAIIDRTWNPEQQITLSRVCKLLEDVQEQIERVAEMLRR